MSIPLRLPLSTAYPVLEVARRTKRIPRLVRHGLCDVGCAFPCRVSRHLVRHSILAAAEASQSSEASATVDGDGGLVAP